MFTDFGKGKERHLAEGITMVSIAHGDKTQMCRFRIAKGAIIPSHFHPHEQIGTMISGSLKFLAEGKERVVGPGDSWCFKSNVEHAAEALEDSVIIEVFSPVREEYL